MFNVFSAKNKPPSRTRPLAKPRTAENTAPSPTFDFYIHKKIGSAKFRVYLAINKADNKQYALKAYPHTEEGINDRYKRESRFIRFVHPNICQIVQAIPEKLAEHSSGVKKYSFLLLEYAPYGDFYELFKKRKALLSEKLARTYFRQLIEGIEYLHEKNVAHLDIKCENLLIGDSFNLKITDFDLSQYISDEKIESRGTVCYRAPEVIDSTCTDFAKADIYAAGVMLFVLRSGGIPPHLEQDDYQGVNLYQLLYEDHNRFWEVHESFQDGGKYYSTSFKKLFHMMTTEDPTMRASLDDIKKSEWYNESILTPEQLRTEMKYFYLV